MDQVPSHETQEFLSGVADQMEAAASKLEASNGAVGHESGGQSLRKFDARFASKLVYTACYTLSYGVCFPIFTVCRYIPRNNPVVNGIVDGMASANKSADEMPGRTKEWIQKRRESVQEFREKQEILVSGVDVLAIA